MHRGGQVTLMSFVMALLLVAQFPLQVGGDPYRTLLDTTLELDTGENETLSVNMTTGLLAVDFTVELGSANVTVARGEPIDPDALPLPGDPNMTFQVPELLLTNFTGDTNITLRGEPGQYGIFVENAGQEALKIRIRVGEIEIEIDSPSIESGLGDTLRATAIAVVVLVVLVASLVLPKSILGWVLVAFAAHVLRDAGSTREEKDEALRNVRRWIRDSEPAIRDLLTKILEMTQVTHVSSLHDRFP